MTDTERPASELEALLDAAVDAIILIDHRGIMQVFNRAAERIFGYSAAEAVGRNVTLLMPEPDRGQHDGYLERYRRTGIPHVIGVGRDVRAQRKDGSTFPGFLSVGQIAGSDPPRFVGFIHDVTLRRQALAAVEHERERANRYLEAAQTMLIGIDTDQRVSMINRKGCEVLGSDEAMLLGSKWFEQFIPAEDRSAAAFAFEALLERQPRQAHYFDCPVMTCAGERRLIAWRAMVVEDAQGAVSEVLWSGDDVTEARRAENELRDTRQRIMQVSRLATIGEMASGISHELNQPLAAIANFAQAGTRLLSASSVESEDIQEALREITAQALRAGDILRRFRSLMRHRQLTLEPASLNEVVTEIESLTHADARASGVHINLDLEPALPPVSVDRVQMQHVLLNLVRNSIDALQTVPLGAREMSISTAHGRNGEVRLVVADSGPGVAEEVRERLFMPFATTKEQGTGLGLVISRSIVEAHHGRLEYQPNRPRGARFIVTLSSEQG
jgi:two-component system, LuxR family, sensor kinase FixL